MYKILIVDDDASRVDKLISHISSTVNIDVSSIYTAASVMAAKKLINSIHFNVLILDIVLPNRDGEPVLPDGGVILLEYVGSNKVSFKPSTVIGVTAFLEKESEYLAEFSSRCLSLVHAEFNASDWLDKLSTAISYSYGAYLDSNSSGSDSVIIALHGIRTYGAWQEQLEKLVGQHCKNFNYLPYKYGVFSIFSFIFPPFRIFQILLFYKCMRSHEKSLIDKDIYFVAHSFGTYILAYALKYYSTFFKGLKIKRLILSGSALKSTFDWSGLFGKYDFQLINDCGNQDSTLCLNQAIIPGVGMAGRTGFVGLNNERMVNRFFDGGHSLYFEKEGIKDSSFMQTYWLECFMSDSFPRVIDQRRTKFYTPLIELLLEVAGWTKEIVFYGGVVYLIYVFV